MRERRKKYRPILLLADTKHYEAGVRFVWTRKRRFWRYEDDGLSAEEKIPGFTRFSN